METSRNGCQGDAVKAVCQTCHHNVGNGEGLCDVCGGVAIRPLRHKVSPAFRDGITPLIQSRIPELKGTWLKLESSSETGSFKDRIMRVLIREATHSGHKAAVVASSGNAAISASFHSSRAGIKLVVIVPTTLSPIALGLLSRFPVLILQYGNGPAESHDLARRLADHLGLPNLSSTFSSSGAEMGCRTIGHEIGHQLPDVKIDTVAASISVGPVLLGTHNGLLEWGRPETVMVAGQAAGCAPITRAFESGSTEVSPWLEPVTTKASSIADTLAPYADEATFFLGQLRQSNGFMAAADDQRLAEIRQQLREFDGVDVELACCAAIHALLESGRVGPESVAVMTGSGQRESLRDEETLLANRHPQSRTVVLESSVVDDIALEVDSWRK